MGGVPAPRRPKSCQTLVRVAIAMSSCEAIEPVGVA
jgi:hypothetical protein